MRSPAVLASLGRASLEYPVVRAPQAASMSRPGCLSRQRRPSQAADCGRDRRGAPRACRDGWPNADHPRPNARPDRAARPLRPAAARPCNDNAAARLLARSPRPPADSGRSDPGPRSQAPTGAEPAASARPPEYCRASGASPGARNGPCAASVRGLSRAWDALRGRCPARGGGPRGQGGARCYNFRWIPIANVWPGAALRPRQRQPLQPTRSE